MDMIAAMEDVGYDLVASIGLSVGSEEDLLDMDESSGELSCGVDYRSCTTPSDYSGNMTQAMATPLCIASTSLF